MAYQIGDKTWFKGNEITITTEPYELYGGMWQDGIDKDGKTFCVLAPEQQEIEVAKRQEDHRQQQASFSELKKSQRL